MRHISFISGFKAPLLAAPLLLLAACDGDFSLKPIGDKIDPVPGTQKSEPRPKPDSRGVITYPNYQVMVARQGDTIASMAARVGLSAGELARYNGLSPDYRPRPGELLALPKSAGTGLNDDIATTTLDDAPGSGREPIRHVVEEGETAYSIARLYGVSVTALASWNGLDRDLTVRPGQRLLIPVTEDGRPADSTAQSPGSGSVAPVPPSSTKPLPDNSQTAGLPESPNLAQDRTPVAGSGKMVRPVSGKIIRGYSKGGNEGIDIAAAAGTDVKAADSGEVALVSSSVNDSSIVLLRHKDNLYTVYSNVTGVTVKKGQSISRGQSIAKVNSGSPAFLHFEIRRGTESVDPAPYL